MASDAALITGRRSEGQIRGKSPFVNLAENAGAASVPDTFCPHCGVQLVVTTSVGKLPPGKEEKSNARAFIGRFCRWWSAAHNGAILSPKWVRDIPLVADLLTTYGEADLEKMAHTLQKTDDPWIAKTERDIPILSSQCSKLHRKVKDWEARGGELPLEE